MIKNKVEICGVNTAKLKILSEAEKEALFARLDSGDKSAREPLILGNLRLVLSVIQRFANRNENIFIFFIRNVLTRSRRIPMFFKFPKHTFYFGDD